MALVMTLVVALPASAMADFVSKWGVPSLNSPLGIATDSLGNVYVTDSHRRIHKFDATGTLVTTWGSFGTGNGQFFTPSDIAVDEDDFVYVTDQAAHRVQKFESDGDYVAQWGSLGDGAGAFNTPQGIDIDAAGNVYVADANNHRIQKFSSTGVFIHAWGTEGTGDGQFRGPGGVAADSAGNVYVADTQNSRIQKFEPDGDYLWQWGSAGSGDGRLSQPRRLATDSQDNVYVADMHNNRIQKLSATGTWLAKWGSNGSADGQFLLTYSIAVNSHDQVYVADGTNRVQQFTSAGAFVMKWGPGGGEFTTTTAVATDASGEVYVTDEGNRRVQKFDASGTFVTAWGGYGAGDGQFLNGPQGIATDPAGDVYVTVTHRVQKFGAAGNFLGQWGSFGVGETQFNSPSGIAVAASGSIYVVDSNNHRVQRFDASMGYVGQWGAAGTGDGQFDRPTGIAVDSAGNVYVADTQNHRVQKFDSAGNFLAKWSGSPSGQLRSPRGLAVDSSGRVYVADSGNDRVQVFTSAGTSIGMWGSRGNADGQFNFPLDVEVAPDGSLLVADGINDRIQRFTIATYQLTAATTGTGSGTVTSTPAGIDCGSDCTELYEHGTKVTLTPTPSATSDFTGWSGACSGTSTCQVTMDQARSVTATFALKSHQLSVSKDGSGSGRVTSNVAGIDCGTDCSQAYGHGTPVTLTASPTTTSSFAGWSGACTGTSTCQVTMTQARSVTATFSDISPPTSTISFPLAATYDEAGWGAGCSGAGGFCGTAQDGNSAISSVQWSLQRGDGSYWEGSAFAAAGQVSHEAVLSATGATSTVWSAAFSFADFPTDGEYTLSVTATDAVGNEETGPTVTFTVDVPWDGSITVVQEATPESQTAFSYGGDLGDFELVDDGTDESLRSMTVRELAPGTYVVQQAKMKGWNLSGIDCGTSGTTVVKLKSRQVTVSFEQGDHVECTFTNTQGSLGGNNPGGGKPSNPGGGKPN